MRAARSNEPGDHGHERQVDGEAAKKDHTATAPVAQRPKTKGGGGQKRRKHEHVCAEAQHDKTSQ